MDKFNIIKNLLLNYKIIEASIKIIEEEITLLKNNEGKIAISYSEKTGPTYKISCPTEDTAISNIARIEELQLKKEIGMSNLKKINLAIDSLDQDESKIINLKYKESKPWYKISNEINCSEVHCRRIRNRAIDKMALMILGDN